MESSLYDLGLAANWSMELFAGALLTNGAEGCDLGWPVLQGGCEGEEGSPAPSQYSAVESPMSEPLQDSIWSECGDVLGGMVELAGSSLKGIEIYGDIDDSLQFVSHRDLNLLTTDVFPCPADAPPLHSTLGSNNIFPCSSSSIDDVQYEYADISTSQEFQCSPCATYQSGSQAGEQCSVACYDKMPPVDLELLLLQQSHEDEIPADLDLGLEPAFGVDPALTLGPGLDPMMGDLVEPACQWRDDEILSMLQRLRQTGELSLSSVQSPVLSSAQSFSILSPVLSSSVQSSSILSFSVLSPVLSSSVQSSSILSSSVLSPVSAEDCESILSTSELEGTQPSAADSECGSADTVDDTDSCYSTLSTDYLRGGFTPKAESHHRRGVVMAPYAAAPASLAPALKTEHRRQKKKEQNKTAALRYREKKREEKGVKLSEVETLEQRNEELRARADDLQREIEYLRALLDEIRQP